MWQRMVNDGAVPSSDWKVRTQDAPPNTIDISIPGRDIHSSSVVDNNMSVHLTLATPFLEERYENWYDEFRIQPDPASSAAGGVVLNASREKGVLGTYVMPNFLHMYTSMCENMHSFHVNPLATGPAARAPLVIASFKTPYAFLQDLMVTIPVPIPAGGVILCPFLAGAAPWFTQWQTSIDHFALCARYMFHACSTEMAYVLINRPAKNENTQWRNRVRYILQLLGYDLVPTSIGPNTTPLNPTADANYVLHRGQIRDIVLYFRCNALTGMIDFEFPTHLSSIVRLEDGVHGTELALATWDATNQRIPQLMHHEWKYAYIPRGRQQQWAIGLFHPNHPNPADVRRSVFSWAKRSTSCIDVSALFLGGSLASDGAGLAHALLAAARHPFTVFDDVFQHDARVMGEVRTVQPNHMFMAYFDNISPHGHVGMPWGGRFLSIIRSMMVTNLSMRPSSNHLSFRGSEERTYGMQAAVKRLFSPTSTRLEAKKREVMSEMQQLTPVSQASAFFTYHVLDDVLRMILWTDSLSISTLGHIDETFEEMSRTMQKLSVGVTEQDVLSDPQFWENVLALYPDMNRTQVEKAWKSILISAGHNPGEYEIPSSQGKGLEAAFNDAATPRTTVA